MKNMTKFQIVLTLIFGLFILIGVLIFATGWGLGTSEVSNVTIWGTLKKSSFETFLARSGLNQDQSVNINYVEKSRETFDSEFIEALASGRGPDLFFLSQDSILKHTDKVYPIPFDTYSERDFRDTFIEEGELYLTNTGSLGLPYIIDPMVMYWNRDLFSAAGLSVPPKFWSEFYDLSLKLTNKDTNLNIFKSAVAMGEYDNVANANQLISLLIMQAGNPITTRAADGGVNNLFSQRLGLPALPTDRAVNFYTEFSNPLKPFYSWNRSLPDSKSHFISGDLAIYFGFASELADIRLKNPNLNFDVAAMPQSSDSGRVITFGNMSALAITRSSQNIAASYRVANILTTAENLNHLSQITNLPPVRRDLLTARPSEAYSALFYQAAVQSRAWLSPEPAKLKPIFEEMIESITGGRSSMTQAIGRASQQIEAALK